MEATRWTEKAQTFRGVACGVLENILLTSRGHIFFIQTPNWVILDLLESLEGVESINIVLESMGGHSRTNKFIFFALFMLSLLQNVPRAIR